MAGAVFYGVFPQYNAFQAEKNSQKNFGGRVCLLMFVELLGLLNKWGNLGLNQGPTGYESAALTTELLPLKD